MKEIFPYRVIEHKMHAQTLVYTRDMASTDVVTLNLENKM